MLLVKLFSFVITVGTINSSKNVCDKDCISDVMLLSKNNLSVLDDLDHNITVHSSVFDNALKFDSWNQVNNENQTSDDEDLPHYIVPGISNYERGT